MRLPEYETHDAVALAGLVARGEVGAGELLDAAIAQIEARDGRLNALTQRLFERARERITRPDRDAGALVGVPYLIKDLGVTIAGLPTLNGTALARRIPAAATSTIVARLEAAGLVICGRSAASEFGLSYSTEPKSFPPTRNPWSLAHTAGGSSGGAAAAVAGGLVPAAHASDGGGSIRVPASCCGLFGLKPSRGRTPVGPVMGEVLSGFAVGHAITRSVRDSAALLDAVAGPEPGDPYAAPPVERSYMSEVGRDPGRLRIALQVTAGAGYPTDPACRAAVEGVAKLCESLGHSVEEASPPFDREAFRQAFVTIFSAHNAGDVADLARMLQCQPDELDLERLTLGLADFGQRQTAAVYARARTDLLAAGRKLGRFFQSYDVLLSPTLAKPPLPLGKLDTDAADVEATLRDLAAFSPFTPLANATGCPAMNVPLAWSEDGLPLGTMFTAALGREDLLFRLAGQLEQARPWWDRRPDTAALEA